MSRISTGPKVDRIATTGSTEGKNGQTGLGSVILPLGSVDLPTERRLIEPTWLPSPWPIGSVDQNRRTRNPTPIVGSLPFQAPTVAKRFARLKLANQESDPNRGVPFQVSLDPDRGENIGDHTLDPKPQNAWN